MTEREKIDYCLKCKRKECDDCISRMSNAPASKPAKLHEWHGKMYTVKQLAEMSGRTVNGIAYRIKAGGVEFAMSACRNLKEWKEKKECVLCSSELQTEIDKLLQLEGSQSTYCTECGRRLVKL